MASLTDSFSKRLINQPRQLFLADGIGALISAFLLYVIVKGFSGMPSSVLNQLAAIALFFSIYSFSCYAFVKRKWEYFIAIICFMNFCYCLLTFSLVIIHFSSLSIAGSIYFIGEIAIIAKLAIIEYKAFRFAKQNTPLNNE